MDSAQTTRRRRPGATEGEWWRFSLYEIRDGCIRPAAGAKLEWYDPWPDFQGTHAQTAQAPASTQPAYQDLMKLVHHLDFRPGPRRYPDCLTQRSQDLILEWCQQYGLLGVLLSRWEAIRVAPQRDHADLWVQSSYSRGFGQAIGVQQTRGNRKDGPRVLIHGLNDLALEEESPSQTWSRFFPSIEFSKRDTFPYPRPYTVEFCQLYAEPLFDFCKAATLLTGAISHLGPTQPQIEGDPKIAREQAIDAVNLLRRPIDSVLDLREDGSVNARRVVPSLLASFAEMFAQDLAYGRAVLVCTCCGIPFVSGAYQAQYCSVSCRLRKQKRRLRAQMKQAKTLRVQGQSLRQIAAAVSQPLAIVKGWLGNAKRKPPSVVRDGKR